MSNERQMLRQNNANVSWELIFKWPMFVACLCGRSSDLSVCFSVIQEPTCAPTTTVNVTICVCPFLEDGRVDVGNPSTALMSLPVWCCLTVLMEKSPAQMEASV